MKRIWLVGLDPAQGHEQKGPPSGADRVARGIQSNHQGAGCCADQVV
jgi:hypothetical protein